MTIAALVGAIAFAEEIKIGIVGIDTSQAIAHNYADAVKILKFFKTGVVPYPPEETEEIFCIMAAAELSAKQGGRIVKLDEIREKAAFAQRARLRCGDMKKPEKDRRPGSVAEISRLNTCFNKWHKNKSAFSVWQFVE